MRRFIQGLIFVILIEKKEKWYTKEKRAEFPTLWQDL